MAKQLLSLVFLVAMFAVVSGQDSKDGKHKGIYTLLGTVKGEIDKVSDGGRKIEVKYKEMVTAPARSSSSSSSTRSGNSAKFKPPPPKEFVLKEKNQEIEVRVLENATIRLLDTDAAPVPAKSNDKKKTSKSSAGKDSLTEEKDDKEKGKETDTEMEKTKTKAPSKTNRKTTEPTLSGKAGDHSSLTKGQVIIITVHREDFPGYSRLVTSSIYILGEK